MASTGRIAEALDWLQDQSEQRGVLDGAQLCVFQGDTEIVNAAVGYDGRRRPLKTETLGQLRCGVAKPLVGLMIASLVAEGRCRWDTPIGSILDGPMHPKVAENTLDDLLCHRAGMHTLPGLLLNMKPPAQRLEMAKTTPPPEGWKRGLDSAYSESCGALLTGAAIEALTGQPYHEVAFERVLGPSGISPLLVQYRPSQEYFDEYHDLIGVSSSIVNEMHVPYLIEGTREMATEWNPSWSGFASAHGQALFFKYVLDLSKGRATNPYLPQHILEEVLWARPNEEAGTHQSDLLKMGRGFHHDLRIIQVPNEHAPNTFGHFGYGVAVAFADHNLDLSVGIRFTNMNENQIQTMRLDRLINAVYSEITGKDYLV